MALSTNQLMLIEQRVTNDAPNVVACYALWLFLGWIGAHRFYLGRPGSAILQFLSLFVLIGFVWWLIDVFLISSMLRERRDDMRQRLMVSMLADSAG